MVHLQPTLEYWTTVERNGPIDQPEITVVERGLGR
jgi:hypothetical protein